jgi:hypothetical protein
MRPGSDPGRRIKRHRRFRRACAVTVMIVIEMVPLVPQKKFKYIRLYSSQSPTSFINRQFFGENRVNSAPRIAILAFQAISG